MFEGFAYHAVLVQAGWRLRLLRLSEKHATPSLLKPSWGQVGGLGVLLDVLRHREKLGPIQ